MPQRVSRDRQNAQLGVILEGIWMDVRETVASKIQGEEVWQSVESGSVQFGDFRVDESDGLELAQSQFAESMCS